MLCLKNKVVTFIAADSEQFSAIHMASQGYWQIGDDQ